MLQSICLCFKCTGKGGYFVGFWHLAMHMLGIWCVAGVVFWFCDVVPRKISHRTRWALIILFGLLTIYTMELAPSFKTETIRIHAIIPLLAAMVFGPLVGIGAGIFSALEQLLFHGFLSYPAEVYMPLIAALIGSLFWVFGKAWPDCRFLSGGVLRPEWGFCVAFFTEALYIFLAYQFYPGEAVQAADLAWITAIPTAFCGAIGAFLCLYIFHDRRLE